MRRLFLDHAATTPLDPQVRAAMAEWLDAGNPSSHHQEGRRAKAALDEARERVSSALGCRFSECIFAGSGTEAANNAIVGAALANEDPKKRRVLLGGAEHHCVLHTKATLERLGYEVEALPVDCYARVKDIEIGDDVLLISIQHANNEFGTINDVARFAGRGALLHVDAVQTFRKLDFKVQDLGADMVTVSAHKIHGPKGVGAMYLRAGVKLKPLIQGGGQEREMRAGTENVYGIVGFGVAATLPIHTADGAVRDHFFASAPFFVRTVPTEIPTLPSHAHGRIEGGDAGTILIRLDRLGVSASGGSACSSGSVEPSHVMRASGFTAEEARGAIRFTFGPEHTMADAEEAARRLAEALVPKRVP